MKKHAIGQSLAAYTSNGGVYMNAMTEQSQDESKKLRIIHTIPSMTDTERESAKKHINSDLYEVFARIQSRLNLESGKNKS